MGEQYHSHAEFDCHHGSHNFGLFLALGSRECRIPSQEGAFKPRSGDNHSQQLEPKSGPLFKMHAFSKRRTIKAYKIVKLKPQLKIHSIRAAHLCCAK